MLSLSLSNNTHSKTTHPSRHLPKGDVRLCCSNEQTPDLSAQRNENLFLACKNLMGAAFFGSSSSSGDSGIRASCDVIFDFLSPWLPLRGIGLLVSP